MAEAKKAEGGITLLNRGQRKFDLSKGGKPEWHMPGATHVYPAEDGAKLAVMYPRELADISKLPGAVDTTKLASDNAKLLADNEALKAQLASVLSAKAEDPASVAEVEAEPKAKQRKADK